MGLIEDALVDEGNFCRQIRGARARREKARADNHQWRAKLAVGDFQSFTDCPQEIVLRKMGKKPQFKTKTVAKMDLGQEIHDSYQQAALDSPNLLMVRPWGIPEDLNKRLEEVWPEIPVGWWYEGRLIVSGIADGCQLYRKSYALVELKTCNYPEEDFKYRFETQILQEKHIHQLKSYIWLTKIGKYWAPYTSNIGELIYINTRSECGESDYERSTWITLTEEDEKKFELQYTEAALQVIAEGKRDCEYKYCRKHGF